MLHAGLSFRQQSVNCVKVLTRGSKELDDVIKRSTEILIECYQVSVQVCKSLKPCEICSHRCVSRTSSARCQRCR